MVTAAPIRPFDPLKEAGILRIQKMAAQRKNINKTRIKTENQPELMQPNISLTEGYAARFSKNRIAAATKLDILRLPEITGETSDSYTEDAELLETEAEEIREESLNVPIENLGPIREQLRGLDTRANNRATGEIKKRAEEIATRTTIQATGDILNAIDIPQEDMGFTFWGTAAYHSARLVNTVCGDMFLGTEQETFKNSSDVARYATREAVNKFLPKYKLINANFADLADAAYALFELSIIGLAVTVIIFLLIITIAIVGGVIALPGAIGLSLIN